MELWRAFDDHNGGVEAKNGAVECLFTSRRRFSSHEHDGDPHRSEKLNPDPQGSA
jgi:hypothetical protein